MNDNQLKARVKAVLNGASADPATSHHPRVGPDGPLHPDHALQVLTLARRTAEEHVGTAKRQADRIRADAQAAADQSARDAQVHAHNVRREAEKILTDARAAAEQIARDSHARTEEARRTAEKIVSDSRATAEQIGVDAQANADHLNLQARQRYDDVVGSLATKREGLQNQIEALEQFDREYRSRLTTFMQGQLRALWVDQPQVVGELPEESAPAAAPVTPAAPAAQAVPPAGRHGADEPEEAVPAQRQSAEDEVGEDEEELSDR